MDSGLILFHPNTGVSRPKPKPPNHLSHGQALTARFELAQGTGRRMSKDVARASGLRSLVSRGGGA